RDGAENPGGVGRPSDHPASQSGFVSLFNGKDLTGWEVMQGPREDWTVENGVLVCSSSGKGWVQSQKQYRDFVLRLEWRVARGGDSGVYLRIPEPPVDFDS